MKKLILPLLITFLVCTTLEANEKDTLWYRWTGAGIIDLDFTPDDNFILAWNNDLMLWDVKTGILDFSISKESVGDFNFNEEFIIFSQDSSPKLLDWRTRDVYGGFEKENKPLGRIKTAKSKNEFMAQSIDSYKHQFYKDQNIIYFWDIDTKQKIDSIVSLNVFDKGGYRWGRKTIEYDYLGASDELVIIKYADNNSYEIPIEPMYHATNTFYHIYNTSTKELIDSIFIFQSTIENNGFHVDRMQVMNNRTKIAWNNKGGQISFYDVISKEFYDKLIFDDGNYEAGDIEFSSNGLIGIAQGGSCCRYIKIYNLNNKELVSQYNVASWGQISFSENDSLLITSVASILALYNNFNTLSSVLTKKETSELKVTNSDNSTLMTVSYEFKKSTNYKLEVFDLRGNSIHTIDEGIINEQHYSTLFDISLLSNGTYFLKLSFGSEFISKQFIKE